MMGAATEKARLPRFSLVLGIESCCLPYSDNVLSLVKQSQLKLHRHDLRVPVGSLLRFKLSLPQCNVPGVLNCMSGRWVS